jgi:hypothetical protein
MISKEQNAGAGYTAMPDSPVCDTPWGRSCDVGNTAGSD